MKTTTSFSHGTVDTAQYTEQQKHAGGLLVGAQIAVCAALAAGAATQLVAYYRLWLGNYLDGAQRLASVILYMQRDAALMSQEHESIYIPLGIKVPASLPVWHDMGASGGFAQADVVLYWS